MEGYDREFWQFSDQLRLQTAAFSGLSLGDSIWSPASAGAASDRRNSQLDAAGLFASPLPADGAKNSNIAAHLNDGGPGLIGSGKLAFGATTTSKADRYNNFPNLPTDKAASYNNNNNINSGYGAKNSNNNGFALNKMGSYGYNNNSNSNSGGEVKSYFNKSAGRPASNNNNSGHHGGKNKQGGEYGKKKHGKNEGGGNNAAAGADKRFKTLPASEALPRGEAVGGYIFVCNNDTMDENLRRELFGRAAVSVQGLGAGDPARVAPLPLQLLHPPAPRHLRGRELRRDQHRPNRVGGQEVPRRVALPRTGSRGDAEDLRPAGGGRLPPHPALHHYDGPKFRLELSVTEALALLDIFADKDDA
ncbi:unnamed protein product [Urochloa decumbens]|uniref:DCD domain-containing protein n=1 Tax=Urochloa decumbens TaxID=240449 RepID=A0ABC8YT50_9POAL